MKEKAFLSVISHTVGGKQRQTQACAEVKVYIDDEPAPLLIDGPTVTFSAKQLEGIINPDRKKTLIIITDGSFEWKGEIEQLIKQLQA